MDGLEVSPKNVKRLTHIYVPKQYILHCVQLWRLQCEFIRVFVG